MTDFNDLKDRLAVQYYSFNKRFSEGYEPIFRDIAAIGFAETELCGGCTVAPEKLKALLEAAGLSVAGWHYDLDTFAADYEGSLQLMKTVGCRQIAVPWYDTGSDEKLDALCQKVNTLAPRLQSDGITLSYHNHTHEFRLLNGVPVLDVLLERCPLLQMELDVYWCTVAGFSPAEYLKKYTGRVSLVHLKDGTGEDRFTALGKGMVDMPAVLSAASACGARRLIVENDNPQPDAVTNLQESFQYLSARL